jgi:hypothetical protein
VGFAVPVPFLVGLLERAVDLTGPVGRSTYGWVPTWGTFGIYATCCVVLAVAATVRADGGRTDYRTLVAVTVLGVVYSVVTVSMLEVVGVT